ncbi:MAG: META domain-containing protein [Alphaproteobacteria bacterium]|nr:META domain-containing protein [Alphaproteobacteria bacterium]
MKKILAVFLMLFAVSACKEDKVEGAAFKGHEYKVVNALNDSDLRISFDDSEDRYFGKIINNYNGVYKVDGENITFGPAMSTMMAGDPEMMKIEYEFLKFLPAVKKYRIEEGFLVLSTEKDDVYFRDMGPISKN